MGKAEVGTPKYIANKMKAKGLQKLRWYCQMCQKQCRDENGFKCHTTSESHQRQLLLFADNSRKYMDEFSFEFSKGYLEILRRQFGTKRVAANRVYQEYIADREHLHMNATRWVTLTGFVKYLGKSGKCIVDETDKGWYITYIDRDPETIAKEKDKEKKIKMEKDDEERTQEFINKQVKIAEEKAAVTGGCKETVFTELVRENVEEKIQLDIKLETVKAKVATIIPINLLAKRSLLDDDNISVISSRSTFKKPKKVSAIQELIQQEELKKEKNNRKDYWLVEGIVVKVVTKSLGEDYYKQKGVVVEVRDRFTAVVKLLETGKKLKLDQEHLETVIPAIGKLVVIVNGAYRGEKASLLVLDEKRFCVDVEISTGPLQGRVVNRVQYEDISKLHTE